LERGSPYIGGNGVLVIPSCLHHYTIPFSGAAGTETWVWLPYVVCLYMEESRPKVT